MNEEERKLQQEKIEWLKKIHETSERNLAVQILNAKINSKIAVVLNAISVIEYKEFIELINQI